VGKRSRPSRDTQEVGGQERGFRWSVQAAGPARSTLAATTLRADTLADMNRGRLRGWIIFAAVGFVILSVLSLPGLLSFVIFLVAAAACL
jgi:hypothetical protein